MPDHRPLSTAPTDHPSADRQGLVDLPGNPTTPLDPALPWRVRVYWEDTDAGGVVFYANYLRFFERARTEWLRARGVQQEALRQASGLQFVVTETHLRYWRPARLDDLLHISAEVVSLGRASMQFRQQAWRGPDLLAEGSIRVGCVNALDFRPARMPANLLEKLQ